MLCNFRLALWPGLTAPHSTSLMLSCCGVEQEEEEKEEGGLAEPPKVVHDDEPEESRAQRIVHTLYNRYEKQMQRWGDYKTLFAFLSFVALFLVVLYLQRSSNIAYKVHSTIWDVVQPSASVYQSKQDVYDWMRNLLGTVWKDPVCGDGLCEVPFEYPSYGRFGCRADCGRLTEKFNLTKLQLDIYYNFDHPVGSLPASVRPAAPIVA